MAYSDGDYIDDELSDDDEHLIQGIGTHSSRSMGPVRGIISLSIKGGDREAGSSRRKAVWEDIQRSWDTVVEGADGSLNSTVEGLREAVKRKRCAG